MIRCGSFIYSQMASTVSPTFFGYLTDAKYHVSASNGKFE